MKACEARLAATSTRHAELLRGLKLHYPRTTPQRRRELQALRRKLNAPRPGQHRLP